MNLSTFKTSLSTFLIAVSVISWANAQSDVSHVLVSASLLRKHVFVLASDSLQGRETGTKGQQDAALYCTQQFRLSHLQYFMRSDQYNFAKLGIPTLFFTSGEHPDYHQPSDTADKIVYNVLQKRATLVFQTAWLVANEAPK